MALVPEGRTLILDSGLEQRFGTCGALLLQQVHFWCETHPNTRAGKVWCYNTYEAWSEQVHCSVSSVRRAVKVMTEAGVLIIGDFNKKNYDRTLWYRVDYKALVARVAETEKDLNMNTPMCSTGTHPCVQPEHSHVFNLNTPIPEMNTEKNAYIGSASAKTEKPSCNPEEQTGKENEKQEKQKLSKEELLAMPAYFDLPVHVKKHTSLAEQVGTGEMKIATAKEIMAAQSAKAAKTHKLPSIWQKHKFDVTGLNQKPLTVKEMAQLKMFSKYMGEQAEVVLRHTLENWWVFAAEAKAAAGLDKMPTEPEPGYLLKYCEHAMRLYLQSIAEPAQIEVKHVPVVPVAPVVPPAIPGVTYNELGEEIYKPTQAQINALLAEL